MTRLAEILGVSVDELMSAEKAGSNKKLSDMEDIISLILRAVGAAMGIAVAVLSILGGLDARTGMAMLGIGLAAIAIDTLGKGEGKDK